jgi:trans-aconitate methyltransferase
MSVASHLGISVVDYDAAILTLIPHYDALLAAAVEAVDTLVVRAPRVVDLGVGSGALAARVLRVRPRARIIGIDEDASMLGMARHRLRPAVELVHANFERAALPRCDLITASYALHHVKTRRRKAALYRRAFDALRAGGVLVTGDNFLASNAALRRVNRARWLAHLRRRYSPAKAEAFLRAWAKEDVYFPLEDEVAMLTRAGFRVDVAWRCDSFAVICGVKPL